MSFRPRRPRRPKRLAGGLLALLTVFGLGVAVYQAEGDDRPAEEKQAALDHGGGHTGHAGEETHTNIDAICVTDLPPEAHETIDNILEGGPHPHDEDGGVFKNREGILPPQENGYYHEFTVETPGLDHRGARRIVTGGEEADQVEDYYTSDHYESFNLIDYKCDGSAESMPPTTEVDKGYEGKPRHPERIEDPICVNKLPDEAHDTLGLIWKGGPFPFPGKDGSVFDNRPSNPLPEHANGYYREYTVITPGASNRGRLRIVTGGEPADRIEDWWTDDHYETFHLIDYTCGTFGSKFADMS